MEVEFNEEIVPDLVDRVTKLTKILKRLEVELEKKMQPDIIMRLNMEDLTSYYALVSKNQMALLEFIRKMMLLPPGEDSKVRKLVNRLMSLSENSLKLLENQVSDLEATSD